MMLAIAAALLSPGAPARAQQPSAEPGRTTGLPTAPPEYGASINIEQAKAAAEGALGEARKNNWHMAVCVVGPEGELIYLEKMDGTQSSSTILAQAKARTSALFRRPSKAFVDQFAAGNAAFLTFPDEARPIASEGGIPIILAGRLIGAIGVSGGTASQDSIAATAGANAVK